MDSFLFIKPHTEEIVKMSANHIAKLLGVGVLNVRKGEDVLSEYLFLERELKNLPAIY